MVCAHCRCWPAASLGITSQQFNFKNKLPYDIDGLSSFLWRTPTLDDVLELHLTSAYNVSAGVTQQVRLQHVVRQSHFLVASRVIMPLHGRELVAHLLHNILQCDLLHDTSLYKMMGSCHMLLVQLIHLTISFLDQCSSKETAWESLRPESWVKNI